MLTHQFLACIEEYDRKGGSIKNYATGTLTPLKDPGFLLNWIALSNSTMGQCAPIQAAKHPVHGRALNAEEQIVPRFRRTMIRVTLQVFRAKLTCLPNFI